jgi:hypothetical protein
VNCLPKAVQDCTHSQGKSQKSDHSRISISGSGPFQIALEKWIQENENKYKMRISPPSVHIL